MPLRVKAYGDVIRAGCARARQLGVHAIIRVQDRSDRTVAVSNGSVDAVASDSSRGIGVHVFTGDGHTGFACSDRLDPVSSASLVEYAADLAYGSRQMNPERNTAIALARAYSCEIPSYGRYGIDATDPDEDKDFVLSINNEARAIDARASVRTVYQIAYEEWRIARTDGTDTMFAMPRAFVMNSITARQGGDTASTAASICGHDGSILREPENVERFRKRTVRAVSTSCALLGAPRVKSGSYSLVIDYALAKGLAHEAFGHAAESDSMNTSVLARDGKFMSGEKVGADIVTITDGPIEGDYAYQPVDSNGMPRESVDIVRGGVLSRALADIFSSDLAGVMPTGAARAESYRNPPLPRMTNIRITVDDPLPIDKAYEDIYPEDIRDVLERAGLLKDRVLYLSGYRGGQVNPAKGDFVFNCSAIYDLTDLKLYRPAIFSGNLLSALKAVTAGIGGLAYNAMGHCGKQGQTVPSSGGGNLFLLLRKDEDIVIGGVSS